jgi:ABC-type multidrug transport system ATPase subunit
MSVIVRATNITKTFGGEIKAVDGLSLSVEAGQVYGFLGQNGAGKSTTIRMLLTLISPSSGDIEIFGLNLARHRKEILQKTGAIIERPDLYKYLTALENLQIFAKMSGVKLKEKELMQRLAIIGLAERAHSRVQTYSQGMKQRLGIAVALVHDPELIILDEPTNGLDPQGIADVRRLILHLSNDLKKTLIVSSHMLAEMEMIADSMLIIDKGKKVVEGRTSDLLNPERIQVEILTDNKEHTLDVIKTTKWMESIIHSSNGNILLEIQRKNIPDLNRALVERGVNIFSIRPKHSLEDFFLAMTRT